MTQCYLSQKNFMCLCKKVGNKWSKGNRLDARVFFVEINESGKVVLKAIDEKPKGKTAERHRN